MKHLTTIMALGLLLLVAVGCSNSEQVSNTKPSSTPSQTGSTSNIAAQANTTAQANSWNPQEACNYLSGISGLQTRGYKNKYEDVFGCSSAYKELGAGSPLANNLAYYVDGNAQTANQLKLVLNVNQAQASKEAHAALLSSSQELAQKSLSDPLPKDVSSAITSGKAGKWTIGKADVELKREDFPTGKGYELHFLIKKKA
jgi:hypothetical protein